MKKVLPVLFMFVLYVSVDTFSQEPPNWTASQLMEPAELASLINAGVSLPTIICIGPDDLIPGSIAIGPASEKEHLKKLRKNLSKLNKDESIVIYCGCCPFDRCPNVRPAITELKKSRFTNYKLLNITENIRTNWIDKGYPLRKHA